MSKPDHMTEDQLQAELILRRWIHRKTGVSDFERGMWKAREVLRQIGEAAIKTLAPLRDFIEKGSK